MYNANLDTNRRGWTRQDWEAYRKQDQLFSDAFMQACLNGNRDEVNALLEKASEYHFPKNSYWLLCFSKEHFELYLHVIHHVPEFYQYDSI